MVEDQERVVNGRRPIECYLLEAQVGISQQGRDVGYTCGQMGRTRRRPDTKMEVGPSTEEERGSCSLSGD